MKNTVIIIVSISVFLIGGSFLLARLDNSTIANTKSGGNVSLTGEKQIIEIEAKGGYSPRASNAKAGMPTILKVKTKGTFDCSSALTIPSLGYSANLPRSGTTEIEIPSQTSGSILKGFCAMGMYYFQITFS